MSELERLRELHEYHILDTPPEKEFEEIATIACAVCNTSTSMLTFIDKERLWLKAKRGIDFEETSREYAFCRLALDTLEDVIIVPDSLEDDRFKRSPLVTGPPYIRFYAGVPLKTFRGHVLGSLCVLDTQPRSISKRQQEALRILAQRATTYLMLRKAVIEKSDSIASGVSRLEKLTNQIPGITFELEMNPEGKMRFLFISEGIMSLHPRITRHDALIDAASVFSLIHPEDLPDVRESLQASFNQLSDWSHEYRLALDNGKAVWCWSNAKPEKQKDGSVVWYGSTVNITDRKEYINTLETLLFDISHAVRQPVATLLGITEVIQAEEALDPETLQILMKHIKRASREMDKRLRDLNDICFNIHSSLFNQNRRAS